MSEPITLHVECKLTRTHLVVAYDVENHAAIDAYLLNRLYRTGPAWSMDPDIVYVQLDEGEATVRLAKKLADLPPDRVVAAPMAPFVTPLRAGATYRETIRVPLPVAAYEQYPKEAPPPPDQQDIRRFGAVELLLGYYWRPEGTIEEVKEIGGSEVVVPRTPPGVRPDLKVLASARVAIEVPVAIPVALPHTPADRP
jgi:hypothetical protein